MGRIGNKIRMKSLKRTLSKYATSEKASEDDEIIQEHKDFYEQFEKRFEDPLTVDIKKALNWFLR